VGDLLAFCGIEAPEAGRVLAGGPMQGTALFSLDTPVDKQVPGIHLIRERDLSDEVNLNCVNCGRCVQACPVHLQVHLIGRCVEFDLLDEALVHHPEACLECGLCAYVCPARRPLVQMVQVANKNRRKSS
jgi:electron transport complex protein RnfC